eukprot:Skav209428  [mRNA]  locus=scaffold805:89247:99345:- [translate_table: standard]
MVKHRRNVFLNSKVSRRLVWLLVWFGLAVLCPDLDSQEVIGFSLPGTRRAKVVVTDVDGTLMNSAHQLPDAHRKALRDCVRQGIPVVFATGKHRGPWVEKLLSEVVDEEIQASSSWTLNAPGVFVQGLCVCDAHGRVSLTDATDATNVTSVTTESQPGYVGAATIELGYDQMPVPHVPGDCSEPVPGVM